MSDAATPATGSLQPPAERRNRLLFLLPVLIFAALAAIFLLRLFSGDPSKVPSALIGRPVPAFALQPVPGLVVAGGSPCRGSRTPI